MSGAGTGLVVALVTARADQKSTPPPPTILSGPSTPTTATTATFTFKDSQNGVSFLCALDGGKSATCTSPTTYSALGDGTHTFSVVARSGNAQSSPATDTWVVDTRPPAITIVFPANNGTYNASGWNGGCTGGAGICGVATDPSGVSSVRVSVLQSASGKYWNGSAFSSATEVFNGATGTTNWRYPLSLPGDGSYTAHVGATDGLGQATPSGSYAAATWRIDTVPPPPPVIQKGPDNPTTSTTATFQFSDGESGVSFRCSLDGGGFSSCGPGQTTYGNLAPGDHTFQVQAVDAAGNASAATTFTWTIVVQSGFGISGNLTQLLYPGRTVPLNLILINPFNFDIRILSVSITVQHTTTKNSNPNPGCDGPTNLVVSQSLSGVVVVPRNSTRSLQDLGIPQSQWPQLTMPNLSTNQDACKGTTFSFTYGGTATKA